MTQRRRSKLDRLAIILHRRTRGDSIACIADYFHITKTRVHMLLQQANSNIDVQRQAYLMDISCEQQMSFDFGI